MVYIANTTSKNHFLFSTFLMRDVYKDDFRNIAKDASSFAKATPIEQAERVRSCIEILLKENRKLTQVKKQELDL